MGKHCEGFPGLALRKIIEENNIFLSLKALGKKTRFANAYLIDDAEELRERRFKSVTTVMALTTPEVISTTADLVVNQAVMQDLTRETVQDRYPDLPVITPLRASEHLFRIACDSDFTLFEFFQTDIAGHSMDYARACAVLRAYDTFLASLVRSADAAGMTIVMTSDHGNIESMTSRGHTRNPVPFVAYGPGESRIRNAVSSLVDVTPAILSALQ